MLGVSSSPRNVKLAKSVLTSRNWPPFDGAIFSADVLDHSPVIPALSAVLAAPSSSGHAGNKHDKTGSKGA